MRNLPSVLSALPTISPLADIERALNARRNRIAHAAAAKLRARELETSADAQLTAARVLFARVERELSTPEFTALPELGDEHHIEALELHRAARSDGERPAPRDGRGRFLSKAWLQRA
jgi:hypothetical protein